MNSNPTPANPGDTAYRAGPVQRTGQASLAAIHLMAVVMLKLGERIITITQADLDRLLYEEFILEECADGSFSLQIRSKD